MSHRQLFIFSFIALLLSGCGTSKKTTAPVGGEILTGYDSPVPAATPPLTPLDTPTASRVASKDIKRFDALQIKYARFLKTEPEEIQNLKLYGFIDKWLNTRYLWGGTDERGIDCSALIQRLLSQVYNINIPRTSVQQFFDDWIDKFGSTDYLVEGDLVFFRTDNEKFISHVGMYLKNHMFVNSSSSKGVSIASLDDPYWQRCYVAAGRIKTTESSKLR